MLRLPKQLASSTNLSTAFVNHAPSTSLLISSTARKSARAPFSSLVGQRQLRHHVYLENVGGNWGGLTTSGCKDEHDKFLFNRYPYYQQIRWKRHDSNKKSSNMNIRPPTRKQRKIHNRKIREIERVRSSHNPPGSKAGPRRAWEEQEKEDLLSFSKDRVLKEARDPEVLKYGMEDALLDDLIGNTKYAECQPTPEPVYLGHKYEVLHEQINADMERYRDQLKKLEQVDDVAFLDGVEASSVIDLSRATLPSDEQIAIVLRAFRDKHGTRRKPVGIAKALQYLLQDLAVPKEAFGERIYTTLMTCCRTPAEGRRIMQMMKDAQHSISSYSWSILVDIHAKIGDYDGCVDVMKEMVTERVPPTLAAYTSLLAACYQVCNNGQIAPSIRAKAAKSGWEHWRQMRIVGIEPDVMVYGAILRLCAAQGQPERALGLLQEMQDNQIKPTTLCFSAALRAVARSQSTAVRYERGFSRRNKTRETITLHHGKMARTIVIMAENAEVVQDDGFISALILCAAAAGDVATAKAIYVATQLRSLDHLRTIGPDSHLARLRGEGQSISSGADDISEDEIMKMMLGDGGSETSLAKETMEYLAELNKNEKNVTFQDREYGGKDSRVLSALLHACARSADQNDIGSMWQGRENNGYLCENSLRLLVARHIPEYLDKSIPGVELSTYMVSKEDFKDPEYRGGKRQPKKFGGLFMHPDAPRSLDDLSDEDYHMYVDQSGNRLEEFRQLSPGDVWRIKYGSDFGKEELNAKSTSDDQPETFLVESSVSQKEEHLLISHDTEDDLYFDNETMKWVERAKSGSVETGEQGSDYNDALSLEGTEDFGNSVTLTAFNEVKLFNDGTTAVLPKTSEHHHVSSRIMQSNEHAEQEGEMYFDNETLQWVVPSVNSKNNEIESSNDNAHDEQSFSDSMDESRGRTNKDHFDPVETKRAVHLDDEVLFDDVSMSRKTVRKESLNTYESMILSGRISHSPENAEDGLSDGELFFSDIDSDDTNEVFKLDGDAETSFSDDDRDDLNNVSEVNKSLSQTDENAFQKFFIDLKTEISNSAEHMEEVSEEEARELFVLMQDEYEEVMAMDADEMFEQGLIDSDERQSIQAYEKSLPTISKTNSPNTEIETPKTDNAAVEMNSFEQAYTSEGKTVDFERISAAVRSTSASNMSGDAVKPNTIHQSVAVADAEWVESSFSQLSQKASATNDTKEIELRGRPSLPSAPFIEAADVSNQEYYDEDWNEELMELQEFLPSFSEKRIRRILQVFKSTLGDASLLELVPLCRESMPDYITPPWRKKMSTLTAQYVVNEASRQGLLDVHILNNALAHIASTGRLNGAVEFYATEFQRHRFATNGYSDRLILQMFLKNSRLSQALTFKQNVQEDGRKLDLPSYASLIEYCGRRKHIGSAMILLEECLSIHGAAPGEAYLKDLRIACRHSGLEDRLIALAGKDPIAWLKRGEAELKREYSKRGRRDLQLASL